MTRMLGASALAASARAADEAAAAHRRADHVEIGNLGQELERRRALPRDDPFVVERVHQLGGFARQDFREALFARRQPGLAQLDARAGRLDGRDLRARASRAE